MVDLWVPIFGIVFTFGGTVAIVAIALRFRARKLEHEEIMKALEQGRDLPTLEIKRRPDYFSDLRNGVLLLAGGAGTYFFLAEGDYAMKKMAGLGLIPALIGLGLIALALVVRSIGEKEKKGTE